VSEKRDTGYKLLKKTSDHNFIKWGEWMKRAQLAERKVEVLKSLILLTHKNFVHITVNSTTVAQWNEFLNEFPDEKEQS